MVIHKCDRCGKESEVLAVVLPHPEHAVGCPKQVSVELCPECQEAVLAFAMLDPRNALAMLEPGKFVGKGG